MRRAGTVLSTWTWSDLVLSVWFLKCAIWVSVDSEMAWIERKTFKINISNYKTLGFISSHLKKKNPHQVIKWRRGKKERRKRQGQSRSHSSAMKSPTQKAVQPSCGSPEDTGHRGTHEHFSWASGPTDVCVPTTRRVLGGLRRSEPNRPPGPLSHHLQDSNLPQGDLHRLQI